MRVSRTVFLGAVFFWFVTGPVAASDLAAAAWLELLLVPGIHVAILGMLGAGLWRARSQRSPQSLLAALGLALLSLSLAHLPQLATLTPLGVTVATGLSALIAYWATPAYWRHALLSKAVAMATFGMAGVLEQAGDTERVYCWGCGEAAGTDQLYCARCGQSLVSDESGAIESTQSEAAA